MSKGRAGAEGVFLGFIGGAIAIFIVIAALLILDSMGIHCNQDKLRETVQSVRER